MKNAVFFFFLKCIYEKYILVIYRKKKKKERELCYSTKVHIVFINFSTKEKVFSKAKNK